MATFIEHPTRTIDGMWEFPCPIGDCPDRQHRPYAKARGKNWRPSASDLADISHGGFDGAAYKAAQIASEFALTHGIRQLADGVPFDDVAAKSRVVHSARWNTDADMGTHCHAAAETFAVGGDWDMPEGLYADDADRLEMFVRGLQQWWEFREPEVLASELVVSRDDPSYVGTFDMIVRRNCDDTPVLLDWKTHREKKADRSKKFDKWVKQLNLLGLATHIEHYHGNQLVASVPWAESGLPQPVKGLVVCIESDGSFREFTCPIDPTNLGLIRSLIDVRTFKPVMDQESTGQAFNKYPPRPAPGLNVEAMLG